MLNIKEMTKFVIISSARLRLFFLAAILAISFAACGEGKVDVTEAKYEEKIVVDAYIYPGSAPKDILITRNIQLEKNVDISSIVISDAVVTITDVESGRVYKLDFDPQGFTYRYNGSDWKVAYGKTYRLDVSASIDGKALSTYALTTTPSTDLKADMKDLGQWKYRPVDAAGNVRKIDVRFAPAIGPAFYALSITALDASPASFIYDNAYHGDIDSSDVIDDFDRYRHEYTWLQNIKPGVQSLNFEVEWHAVWFYGKYRAIIYGGDKNFKDFLLTNREVQEMDGNFHEPRLHMNGDGIGIFGSAVTDTVYFTIGR